MTKEEYKQQVRSLKQQWLDAELQRANEKGLTVTGADVSVRIIEETEIMTCRTVRLHATEADADMYVSM